MTIKMTYVVKNVILINNIYKSKIKVNIITKKNRYLNLTSGQVTCKKLRICAHLRSRNLHRRLFWPRGVESLFIGRLGVGFLFKMRHAFIPRHCDHRVSAYKPTFSSFTFGRRFTKGVSKHLRSNKHPCPRVLLLSIHRL